MDAVILIGLQASGKSSFYRDRYFRTHVRISLDMLRTHHREAVFLQACLETGQRFVVDKMNATALQRAPYIQRARAAGFRVVGYYITTSVDECLRRNALRPDPERVPERAIPGTFRDLQPPCLEEGFDDLFTVRTEAGQYIIEPMED
jgi:predicted kinase